MNRKFNEQERVREGGESRINLDRFINSKIPNPKISILRIYDIGADMFDHLFVNCIASFDYGPERRIKNKITLVMTFQAGDYFADAIKDAIKSQQIKENFLKEKNG